MPTGSPDPASVERTRVSGRKAPGIDLHLGAQQGPKVCGLHERTHQFDVTVGEFQQSNGPTDRGPVLSMTGQMPNAGKGKMPPSPSVSEWDVLGSLTLSETPICVAEGQTWAVRGGERDGHHEDGCGEGFREGASSSHQGCHSATGTRQPEAECLNTNFKEGPIRNQPVIHSEGCTDMSTLENELQNKSQVIQQELDSLAERLMRDVDIMAAMAQEFHAPRSKSR